MGFAVVLALVYLVLVVCMLLISITLDDAPMGHEDDDGFHEDKDNENQN